MNMQQLQHAVIAVANGWGLYEHATADAQKLCAFAELGEFADELAKENFENAKMELGDLIVTWINFTHMEHDAEFNPSGFVADRGPYTSKELVEQLAYDLYYGEAFESTLADAAKHIGTTPEQALELALNKISKRTGKFIGGKFVKSEDLEKACA